jgi:hypothetical protein
MTTPTHSDVADRRRMTPDEREDLALTILNMHVKEGKDRKVIYIEINHKLRRKGFTISRSRVYEIIERNR